MKTNQVMESIDRELCGIIVRQRTKDDYFALKDIVAVGNKWRIEQGIYDPIRPERYFALESTKEFMAALKDTKDCEPYIRARGRGESWIHPHIMIDILLWVNPHFKIQVYDWIVDLLMKTRRDSGDSNIKMRGSMFEYARRKDLFQRDIAVLSKNIRNHFGVTDWNKATQEQLKMRDELQTNIADFAKTLQNSYQGLVFACDVYSSKYNIDREEFRCKIVPFYKEAK